MQIFDYSAGYPRASEVKRLGRVGAIRYLKKEGVTNVKPITTTEFNSFMAADLDVGFIYEHVSKSRVNQGVVAGQHDANWALSRIKELGIDVNNSAFAVYFTVDYDAPVGEYSKIYDYYRGVGEVIGLDRTGAYAKWDLLRHLFDQKIITYGWQTYAWSPGHNKDPKTFEPRAHLFQHLGTVICDGIACDFNEILQPYWGQYQKITQPTGEDMQLTDIVGEWPDGSPFTVQDAFTKIQQQLDLSVPVGRIAELLINLEIKVDQLPPQIKEAAYKNYRDLADILYAFDQQSRWADLQTKKWSDVSAKKWVQIF